MARSEKFDAVRALMFAHKKGGLARIAQKGLDANPFSLQDEDFYRAWVQGWQYADAHLGSKVSP